MVKATISLLLMALGLSACATIQVVEPTTATSKVGHQPEFFTEVSTTPGSVIYSQHQYWEKKGYRLQEGISTSLGGGRIQVSAGDFVLKSVADGGTAYCTEKGSFFSVFVGRAKPVCFVDRNEDGQLDQVKVSSDTVWWQSDISPIKFSQSTLAIPRTETLKTELLLQGVAGSTLRLLYREYINDYARPSFFQEATYDTASLPTEIAFKTVRLQILAVSNSGIRYKVLSGF